jgi:hypothetical protein
LSLKFFVHGGSANDTAGLLKEQPKHNMLSCDKFKIDDSFHGLVDEEDFMLLRNTGFWPGGCLN